MCGIIGIASVKPVSGNIIEALKKLEYRGYDSAGLSTIDNDEINEKKCSGRVDNLEKILFKNPSKDSPAGMLIDKAGLKGLTIGQAQISEKHANFFVNVGDAKAEEMLALIKKAKSTVKDKFDIEMSLEVKLMGFEQREIESL